MRRTCHAGADCRAWRQNAKKVGFGTPSLNRKTENQVKARRLRHANAGPSTGPRYAGYCAARGRARILLPVVCDREIYQRSPPKGSPEYSGPRPRTTARHRHAPKTEPITGIRAAAHPVRNLPQETAPDERGTSSSSLKALASRTSLRFIVGDQHSTMSTTPEPKTN